MSRIPDDAPVYVMAVAERITGLTRRQIRYYETMGLLSPARTPGNRRLYSPSDLRRLGEIKRLMSEGLDLRAIASLPEGQPSPAGDLGQFSLPARLGREPGSRYPGAFEDARARLLGQGPAGGLDSVYPSDAGRLHRQGLGTTQPTTPASWLRLPQMAPNQETGKLRINHGNSAPKADPRPRG